MELPTRNPVRKIGIFLFVFSLATAAKGQEACRSLPCQNGGSCVPVQNTYTCYCTDEFTGRNCTELSFKASIGISQIERYLPGITNEPADMTNFNAKRLGRRVIFSFTGIPDSRPNTYNWTLNGTTLDPATNSRISLSDNGHLTIWSGSLADEGEYQVFVSNEFGTLFSRKMKLKFSVTGSFSFPNSPINISMVENEPYLLRCPPRSYSYRVRYDWYAEALQSSSIASSSSYAPRILMEPNGDLLFSFVNRSDFITFIYQGQSPAWSPIRCRMNDLFIGSAVGPPVYFHVAVPATQSPNSFLKFYTMPQGEYTVLTGDQFYLNCTAGGRPVPRIQWYKDDVLITDLPDLFEHDNYNRTLRLGFLSSKTHDGKYKCVAVGPSGNVSALFGVKVIDNVTAIYPSNDQYDLRAGKHDGSVTMFCNTTGHPILSRTWYYNGIELKNSPKFANRWFFNQSNGALEIRKLQLDDFGFYQCLAKNELSEDDRRSFLVVTGAPLPPIDVTITDCANHTTNLTWGMRLPPDLLHPNGFIIEWRARQPNSRLWPAFSKLHQIADGSTRSYVLNNLKPYNEIQFRVRAVNSIGTGFPGMMSSSSNCLTASRKPLSFPKKLKGSAGSNTDGRLKVTWEALDPLDWGGASCLYRIFYRLSSPNTTWNNQTRVFGCGQSDNSIYGLEANSEYEIAIRAENINGPGPSSPVVKALSEQSVPVAPTNVSVVHVDASSVEMWWNAISVQPPKTVDGYWIVANAGGFPNNKDQDCDNCEISPTGLSRKKREVGELPPGVPFPVGTVAVRVINSHSDRGTVTGLQPWSMYTMIVFGYNNAGLGEINQNLETITTLDSKDSYYILSLRITSEKFTEDLRDETSPRFINLKRNLTSEVSSLYQKHRWFKRASLVSFRPGSVQAELQLEVASPNMSVVHDVVSVMDNLGNFSVDRNMTKIRSEPGIQNISVNASNVMVNVSGKIVVSCTVIGGPVDLNITWYKTDELIGLTHRTKVETSLRHSLLTIRDVMAEDEGNYSCRASKGIQKGIANVTVRVVPVLEIQPQAITKPVGDQATFNCIVVSGFRQGARVTIVEVTNKDAEMRYQDTSFTAVNLQIPGGGKSHTRRFVCEMWLQQQLLSRSKLAELVIVPPDAPKCPAERLEGVSWAPTAAGVTDVQPCPQGAIGFASRACSQQASWKSASFIGCRSAAFVQLEDEIEAVTEGFQTDFTAQQVLSSLVNVSQPVANNSRRPNEIYGGDLVISVNILVRLADYNSNQGNVSSAEDVNNYAQVASNLLDSTNSRTWQKLEQAGEGRSTTLVRAVDNYGLGVAGTLSGSTKSRTVQTKNLVLRIDRVNQGSPLRKEGLNVSYSQSSIYLPSQAFYARDSRVVSLVYLTLNDVLSLDKDDDDDQILSPNTTVVSSTVFPRPPDVLNKPPVKIILQNRRVNVPSGVTPKAKCVFWRPSGESATWQTNGCRLVASESDVTITTCECDHLTIFASLMDPYDSSIGEAHKKALEIISIVGCTISLLAVLVTIAVTLFFWRVLKGPRAKVLLNVCAAIALSCIFVISEGSARDNKAGCTVIAVFLHYFLLSLFSWMLCEGVLLYILLVKVFGGGAEDKVKYFYVFGWGFPAIIVVISLAATKAEGYGTTEACWLDVPSGLIWAFIAPALIVISINLVVFILVIRQMMGTRHVQNKTQIEKVKTGFKASAVILPLLGITWLFGLLAFSSPTVAFKYIFTIFNSLQGLMIFIFHCLLNKQIKDAIKRRREKNSSGVVSSTPKSKPSPSLHAKHGVTQPAKAPKKRSKTQNDYEMMNTLPNDKNNTVSTLPFNSQADKNAIIDIPDEQLPEVITHLNVAPEDRNDIPRKVDGVLPVDDGAFAVPVSEEDSANGKTASNSFQPSKDEKIVCVDDGSSSLSTFENSEESKTACDSLIPHTQESQTNGLTREADEELEPEPGHRDSLQGVTNRIYEQNPKGYDPSLEELIQESEEARFSPQESSSSPEINPEEVSCVLEDASLEGALPSTSSQETPAPKTTKMVEPREANDDVKNDEDFEIKMKQRRQEVDTIQRVADAFRSQKENKSPASPSQKAWEKIRQKLHRRSYKVEHPAGTANKVPESREDDAEDLDPV